MCYRKISATEGAMTTDFNIARLVEAAVAKLEKNAKDKGGPGGSSILAAGFRDAGLVPFNPAIFTEESFAASDALLGLHKGHPAVAKAEKTGEAMAKLVVEQAVIASKPEVAGALGRLAQAKQLERQKRLGGEFIDLSVEEEVAKVFYSSDSWAEAIEKKTVAKEKEEADRLEKAEERKAKAEANKAEAAAKSAAFKKRVADNKQKAMEQAAAAHLKR